MSLSRTGNRLFHQVETYFQDASKRFEQIPLYLRQLPASIKKSAEKNFCRRKTAWNLATSYSNPPALYKKISFESLRYDEIRRFERLVQLITGKAISVQNLNTSFEFFENRSISAKTLDEFYKNIKLNKE